MGYSYKTRGTNLLAISKRLFYGILMLVAGIIRLFRHVFRFGKRIRRVNADAQIPEAMTSLRRILDALNFRMLFILWIGYITSFGVFYFLLTVFSPENGLTNYNSSTFMSSLLGSIYFSFTNVISTGFNDIVPLGASRIFPILEILGSTIIFALVISRLVSVKQGIILSEIYEISLNEQANRLRSALYLSRSDMTRINEKIIDGRASKVTIEQFWSVINSVHETTLGIHRIICPKKNGNSEYTKKVGGFEVELLMNSMTLTIKKIGDILAHMNAAHHNWRSPKNVEMMKSMLSTSESIQEYFVVTNPSYTLRKRLDELGTVRNEVEKQL